MQRTAQCSCGSLRAVASGEPRFNNICSSQACQRRTGSVIAAGAYFLTADMRCEGASKVYIHHSDSGREVHLHFCPECGTTVYFHADRAPGLCGISVGCFADPDFPAPSFSVWEESLHPWLGIPANVKRYPKSVDADVVDQVLRDAADDQSSP
jgi:hypothetical protein